MFGIFYNEIKKTGMMRGWEKEEREIVNIDNFPEKFSIKGSS